MKGMAWIGLLVAALLGLVWRADAQTTSRYFAGVRLHRENKELKDLPYDKGDLSAVAAWEIHEGPGFWQLALQYTWDLESSDTVDSILTPQLNLIFRDQAFVGGAGILASYVEDEEQGKKWTSLYYQALLGLEFPLGKLNLTVYAVYPFKNLDGFDDFRKRLEYMGGLSVSF